MTRRLADRLYAARGWLRIACVVLLAAAIAVLPGRLHCPGWTWPFVYAAAYGIGTLSRDALATAEGAGG